MLNLLKAHWPEALAVLASLCATILMRAKDYYSTHPTTKPGRLARLLLSLVTLLPAKGGEGRGLRLMIGPIEIQVPLLSWSRPKAPTLDFGAMRAQQPVGLLLILTLLVAGCGGWRTTAATALDKTSRAADVAHPTMMHACQVTVKLCKTNPCPALDKCIQVKAEVTKLAIAAQLLVIQGYDALELGDRPRAEALLAEALALYKRLRELLALYDVRLP